MTTKYGITDDTGRDAPNADKMDRPFKGLPQISGGCMSFYEGDDCLSIHHFTVDSASEFMEFDAAFELEGEDYNNLVSIEQELVSARDYSLPTSYQPGCLNIGGVEFQGVFSDAGSYLHRDLQGFCSGTDKCLLNAIYTHCRMGPNEFSELVSDYALKRGISLEGMLALGEWIDFIYTAVQLTVCINIGSSCIIFERVSSEYLYVIDVDGNHVTSGFFLGNISKLGSLEPVPTPFFNVQVGTTPLLITCTVADQTIRNTLHCGAIRKIDHNYFWFPPVGVAAQTMRRLRGLGWKNADPELYDLSYESTLIESAAPYTKQTAPDDYINLVIGGYTFRNVMEMGGKTIVKYLGVKNGARCVAACLEAAYHFQNRLDEVPRSVAKKLGSIITLYDALDWAHEENLNVCGFDGNAFYSETGKETYVLVAINKHMFLANNPGIEFYFPISYAPKTHCFGNDELLYNPYDVLGNKVPKPSFGETNPFGPEVVVIEAPNLEVVTTPVTQPNQPDTTTFNAIHTLSPEITNLFADIVPIMEVEVKEVEVESVITPEYRAISEIFGYSDDDDEVPAILNLIDLYFDTHPEVLSVVSPVAEKIIPYLKRLWKTIRSFVKLFSGADKELEIKLPTFVPVTVEEPEKCNGIASITLWFVKLIMKHFSRSCPALVKFVLESYLGVSNLNINPVTNGCVFVALSNLGIVVPRHSGTPHWRTRAAMIANREFGVNLCLWNYETSKWENSGIVESAPCGTIYFFNKHAMWSGKGLPDKHVLVNIVDDVPVFKALAEIMMVCKLKNCTCVPVPTIPTFDLREDTPTTKFFNEAYPMLSLTYFIEEIGGVDVNCEDIAECNGESEMITPLSAKAFDFTISKNEFTFAGFKMTGKIHDSGPFANDLTLKHQPLMKERPNKCLYNALFALARDPKLMSDQINLVRKENDEWARDDVNNNVLEATNFYPYLTETVPGFAVVSADHTLIWGFSKEYRVLVCDGVHFSTVVLDEVSSNIFRRVNMGLEWKQKLSNWWKGERVVKNWDNALLGCVNDLQIVSSLTGIAYNEMLNYDITPLLMKLNTRQLSDRIFFATFKGQNPAFDIADRKRLSSPFHFNGTIGQWLKHEKIDKPFEHIDGELLTAFLRVNDFTPHPSYHIGRKIMMKKLMNAPILECLESSLMKDLTLSSPMRKDLVMVLTDLYLDLEHLSMTSINAKVLSLLDEKATEVLAEKSENTETKIETTVSVEESTTTCESVTPKTPPKAETKEAKEKPIDYGIGCSSNLIEVSYDAIPLDNKHYTRTLHEDKITFKLKLAKLKNRLLNEFREKTDVDVYNLFPKFEFETECTWFQIGKMVKVKRPFEPEDVRDVSFSAQTLKQKRLTFALGEVDLMTQRYYDIVSRPSDNQWLPQAPKVITEKHHFIVEVVHTLLTKCARFDVSDMVGCRAAMSAVIANQFGNWNIKSEESHFVEGSFQMARYILLARRHGVVGPNFHSRPPKES